MYQSAKAHHGPSQASNSNLFAKIVNVFKLTSSSHQRFSVGKGVLKKFVKFTGKHLCQSVFLVKLQASGLQLY